MHGFEEFKGYRTRTSFDRQGGCFCIVADGHVFKREEQVSICKSKSAASAQQDIVTGDRNDTH